MKTGLDWTAPSLCTGPSQHKFYTHTHTHTFTWNISRQRPHHAFSHKRVTSSRRLLRLRNLCCASSRSHKSYMNSAYAPQDQPCCLALSAQTVYILQHKSTIYVIVRYAVGKVQRPSSSTHPQGLELLSHPIRAFRHLPCNKLGDLSVQVSINKPASQEPWSWLRTVYTVSMVHANLCTYNFATSVRPFLCICSWRMSSFPAHHLQSLGKTSTWTSTFDSIVPMQSPGPGVPLKLDRLEVVEDAEVWSESASQPTKKYPAESASRASQPPKYPAAEAGLQRFTKDETFEDVIEPAGHVNLWVQRSFVLRHVLGQRCCWLCACWVRPSKPTVTTSMERV